MKFHTNIMQQAKENTDFRHEVATGGHAQVVLMSIEPGDETDDEMFNSDHIAVFVDGEGEIVLDSQTEAVAHCELVFIPTSTKHNIRNTGKIPLKFFVIYCPPEWPPGTVQPSLTDAQESYGE